MSLICIFAITICIKAVKQYLELCSINKATAIKRILLVSVNPLKYVFINAIGIFICEALSVGFKLLSSGKMRLMLSSSNAAERKVNNMTIINLIH